MIYKSDTSFKKHFELLSTGGLYVLILWIILLAFNFHLGFTIVGLLFLMSHIIPLLLLHVHYLNHDANTIISVDNQKMTIKKGISENLICLDKCAVFKIGTRKWTLVAFPWEGKYFYYRIECDGDIFYITSLVGTIAALDNRAKKIEKFYPILTKNIWIIDKHKN